MKVEKEKIYLPEGDFDIQVIKFDNSDRLKLFSIYLAWRELCKNLNSMKARGVNLPEGLSESAFCLEMNCFRITESISGANTSFDAYDPIFKEPKSDGLLMKNCFFSNI